MQRPSRVNHNHLNEISAAAAYAAGGIDGLSSPPGDLMALPEAIFHFYFFQRQLPPTVVVRLPRAKPYATVDNGAFFYGHAIVAELYKQLGLRENQAQVHFLDTHLQEAELGHVYPSTGTYYAYVTAKGLSPPLWYDPCSLHEVPSALDGPDNNSVIHREVLVVGGHFLATERYNVTGATRFFRKVLHLRRNDVDFSYSLFSHLMRHGLSELATSLNDSFHASIRHSLESFWLLEQDMGRSSIQRLSQRRAWIISPVSPSTSNPSLYGSSSLTPTLSSDSVHDASAAASLAYSAPLDLLLMLPPPFRLIDILPIRSLVALAHTSKAWYSWIVGRELPALLRRMLADPALEPFTWRFKEIRRVADTKSITSSSFSFLTDCPTSSSPITSSTSSSSSSSTSHESSDSSIPTFLTPADLHFPKPWCPPLLKWMAVNSDVGLLANNFPSLAMAEMLRRWRRGFAEVSDPACPQEKVTQLLMLLGHLAVASAGHSHRFARTEKLLIYFYVPFISLPSSDADGEEDESASEERRLRRHILEEDFFDEDRTADGGFELVWKAEWGEYKRKPRSDQAG